MNNSMVQFEDSAEDVTPMLRKKQTELLEIIEAIDSVKASHYWKILQSKIFDGVLDSVQRQMRNVTEQTDLFRLQGQLMFADKFANLDNLAKVYRNELERINKQLKKENG